MATVIIKQPGDKSDVLKFCRASYRGDHGVTGAVRSKWIFNEL